jgi:hypothetical protein
MARFTKKVELTAFQFNRQALTGMDEYDMEDLIIEELDLTDGIKSVFIDDKGNLDLVIYTYGKEHSKEHFELRDGEWLTNNGMEFAVVPNANFKGFATPLLVVEP